MSFILEALNRAERERADGSPSRETTLQYQKENGTKRRGLRLYLFSLAGTLTALGAYLVLQLWENGGISRAVLPPPPPLEPQTAAPPHENRPELKPAVIGKEVQIAPDDSGENRNAPRLSTLAAKSSAPMAHTVPEENLESGPPVAQNEPVPEEEPAFIPILQNLPPSERRGIPELELNVHVYSRNPAKRFVYINSQRYGEGAKLSGEIRIERITRDGVILQSGDIPFRLPVPK